MIFLQAIYMNEIMYALLALHQSLLLPDANTKSIAGIE